MGNRVTKNLCTEQTVTSGASSDIVQATAREA